jgi:UDP-glucuronate decarboxylase
LPRSLPQRKSSKASSSKGVAPGNDLDRQSMQFAAPALSLLRSDERRIVIVGARGWIGRTLLALLHAALDSDDFARRVVCFGSAERAIVLDDGTRLDQHALDDLAALPRQPTVLFHLAFLTKDKVVGMEAQAYCAANRALSQTVHDALDRIGVDRLFVASSGAAAFADDPGAAGDLRLYGALKREDEERFAAWARNRAGTCRVAIGRIYSVSGPWMNKHETYALASFILDALAGRPIEVRAPRRVLRSYVAVREVLSVVVCMLLSTDGLAVQSFATGGEALELGEVAAVVAQVSGAIVSRRPISELEENRYTGDAAAWTALLARYGMTHLPLDGQVAETAVWLAQKAEES